jgi:hypothetical protein
MGIPEVVWLPIWLAHPCQPVRLAGSWFVPLFASDKLFWWLFKSRPDHILPALIPEAQMAVVALRKQMSGNVQPM